jgi:protein phosphatase
VIFDQQKSVGSEVSALLLLVRYSERAELASRFDDAYQRYCWTVTTADDLRLAPFHILATEGAVHVDKDRIWHMERASELCAGAGPVLMTTAHRIVDVTDAESIASGVAWWEEMTARGSEGMVVKPLSFIARSRRGLIQPRNTPLDSR